MKRGTILILLGALVALSPFLGIPDAWLIRLDIILGLAISYFGYSTVPKGANVSVVRPEVQK